MTIRIYYTKEKPMSAVRRVSKGCIVSRYVVMINSTGAKSSKFLVKFLAAFQ